MARQNSIMNFFCLYFPGQATTKKPGFSGSPAGSAAERAVCAAGNPRFVISFFAGSSASNKPSRLQQKRIFRTPRIRKRASAGPSQLYEIRTSFQ